LTESGAASHRDTTVPARLRTIRNQNVTTVFSTGPHGAPEWVQAREVGNDGKESKFPAGTVGKTLKQIGKDASGLPRNGDRITISDPATREL
jgi:hypothetical protein